MIVQAGKMWVQDDDTYFKSVFNRTGDQFDADDLLNVMNLFVTDFGLAVDVGAHYGSWTRLMASRFDRVIAIEASPSNFECLVMNTDGLSNVELIEVAVGECNGSVSVGFHSESHRSNSGGASVVGDGNIPLIPIDSLNLPKMGLMKFDIEGYEIFAMRGGINTILAHKPVIIIEDNIRNTQYGFDVGDNVKFLQSLGATLVAHYEESDNYVLMWK